MGIFARKRLQNLIIALALVIASVTSLLTNSVFATAGDIGPWQSASNSIPEGRVISGSVELNGYIYVIGGRPSEIDPVLDSYVPTATVYYSHIDNDGQPGAWLTTTSLPEPIEFVTGLTANGYIYATDGANLYYAHANSDGTLGSWSTISVPEARILTGAVIVNNYIYLIGGSVYDETTETESTPPVYYAHLNPDGSVGEWIATTISFPGLLTLPNVVTNNGYIYVLGGAKQSSYDFNPANKAVYYTHVNADGSIDPWTTSDKPIPETQVFAMAVTTGGYLYIMGGSPDVTANTALDTVLFSHVNSDGSIDDWQTSSNPLPLTRTGAIMVKANNYIYVIGGWSSGIDASQSRDVYFTSVGSLPITAPTGLTASTPTNQKPALSWNNVSSATAYTIYRNGNSVGTSTVASFIDSALTTDGNYTYTVAASNGSTTGAQSLPIAVQYDKTLPTTTNGSISGWLSIIGATPTITATVSDNLSGVTGGEYFTDTDPGQGNGKPMTYDSSTGKIKAVVTIKNQSSGTHKIYMRSKDAAGNWSTTVYVSYYQL